MKRTRRSSPRGAVLIIVLWVLSLLTALGVGLSYRVGLDAKRASAVNGKIQAGALSSAAIQRLMFELDKDDQGYDALTDSWSNDANLYNGYRLETGSYTVSFERTNPSDPSQRITVYGAQDEESRINVNTASKEMLERLFKWAGYSPDLAETVLDWTDADGNTRFHGAEAYDYASGDRPYMPSNGKMLMLEELLLVKGIRPEIYEKIAPFLTVYGEGRVNINTAGPEVLEILGFSPELIQKIMRYRRGLDDMEGTEDDGVFRSMARVSEDLDMVEAISNADRFTINNLSAVLTVSSRFFRIQAQGKSPGGVVSRVTAVVQRFPRMQKIPARIIAWREG